MFGITIAGAITAAVTVSKALAVVGLAVEGLKMIGSILMTIGKVLGIFKTDMEPEDLGDKALQAEEEGITPENYETYDEYVKAIEEFEVDPEKSKSLSSEAKLGKALEIIAAATFLRFPQLDPQTYLALGKIIAQNMETFSLGTGSVLGTALQDNPLAINHVVGYITGSEKNEEYLASGKQILTDIVRTSDPNLSQSEVREKINSITY